MDTVSCDTTRFGRISADASQVIELPDGMIGFPDDTRYLLVKQRADSVFYWLQSMHSPALAFPVVLPWAFYWDYEVRISDEDLGAIDVTDVSQLSILCVANVGSDVRKGTINLFSPVVINVNDNRGRQVINTADGYSTRDPLFRGVADPTPVAIHDDESPHVLVIGDRAA